MFFAFRPSNGYETETDDDRLCGNARGSNYFVVVFHGVPICNRYQSSTVIHERAGLADFHARWTRECSRRRLEQ